jgi:SAM-dependent methyltransferase
MDEAQGYDALPYQDLPLPRTRPAHLAAIGQLFGMDCPDPARARVLEVGCASGGNLIPLAYYAPGGRYVGVDLSPSQIARGQTLIEAVGLDNIELIAGDIAEVGGTLGTFDYIIVHGLYSWVPEAVRDSLLSLLGKALSPQGIAYLSYNTRPGWGLRGGLRELLLYHTRGLAEPRARLDAALDCLRGLQATLKGRKEPSTPYLASEIEYLLDAHPSYLYHEFLEADNAPVLFSELVAAAEDKGLRYLAESELRVLLTSTFGEAVEAFADRGESLIEEQQYLDFATLRPFRESLFCRAEAPVAAEIDLARMDALSLRADLSPPDPLELRAKRRCRFKTPDGGGVEVAQPITRAALGYLHAQSPRAVALPELLDAAIAALGGTPSRPAMAEALRTELFGLFAHDLIDLEPATPAPARAPDAPMAANALARAQAALGAEHLATPAHRSLAVDALTRAVVGLMDGSRDLEALRGELSAAVAAGHLPADGLPVDAGREPALRDSVRHLAVQLQRYGLC